VIQPTLTIRESTSAPVTPETTRNQKREPLL